MVYGLQQARRGSKVANYVFGALNLRGSPGPLPKLSGGRPHSRFTFRARPPTLATHSSAMRLALLIALSLCGLCAARGAWDRAVAQEGGAGKRYSTHLQLQGEAAEIRPLVKKGQITQISVIGEVR